MEIVDACLIALGKALPEKAMAGWCKHFCPIHMGTDPNTIDPRTGLPRQYFIEHFASDGGSGALNGFDGWHGISFMGSAGNFSRPSVEFFETSGPFVVTRYEVLKDWEGAGEFRGSPGVYTETVSYIAPGASSFIMTGNSDGTRFSPPGVTGGGSPPCSEMWITGADGKRRPLRTMDFQPIFPGDVITTKCSGGGGWGDPLKRDIHKVQDDVMDGLVSIERARDCRGSARLEIKSANAIGSLLRAMK